VIGKELRHGERETGEMGTRGTEVQENTRDPKTNVWLAL